MPGAAFIHIMDIIKPASIGGGFLCYLCIN